MAKYSETELAAVVVDYLESKDWNVYQEVGIGYSSADIVAVNKDNQIWIIECKTSLNFYVIAQAEMWDVHYRSVAVPEIRKPDIGRNFAYKTCSKFGIGVLEVSVAGHDILIRRSPTLQNGQFAEHESKRILESLTPYHKNGVAGSTSGGAITPYKVTMLKIREFIEANPGCSLTDIIGHIGKAHYASEKSARNAISTALNRWEDWCKVIWVKDDRRYGFFVED